MTILEYLNKNAKEDQKERLSKLEDIKEPILVGISGTIAKTTVVELIGNYLMSVGKRVLMTGTSGIKSNDGIIILGYNCTSAPDITTICEFFMIALEKRVDYIVMETTAESTSVNIFKDVHFNILTITNIIKEIVRSFGSQDEYIRQKTRLYIENEIDTLIFNRQCEAIIADAVNSNKTIKQIVSFDKHNAKYCVDYEGKLNFEYGNNYFATNLLSSINLDNIINFIEVIAALGLFVENYVKKFLLDVMIPGRLEHYFIDERSIIIDSGYGGVSSIVPYFNESPYQNTYIVLSTYCFESDKDNLSIIKSFRQNKAATFGQYGKVILTTGSCKEASKNQQIALDQMKEAVEYYLVEPNRYEAIKYALKVSSPGDRIFITGKGTETYALADSEETKYSDTQIIFKIIEELRKENRPE